MAIFAANIELKKNTRPPLMHVRANGDQWPPMPLARTFPSTCAAIVLCRDSGRAWFVFQAGGILSTPPTKPRQSCAHHRLLARPSALFSTYLAPRDVIPSAYVPSSERRR